MPSIRAARLSDAQAIAQLTSQLGYEVSPSAVAERLSHILSRPTHELAVAEIDGHVIAWVHASAETSIETGGFVRVGGLVVDAEYRRQGVGHALMTHVEEWATRQGSPVVRLWSSAARTAAHAFYERLGYANVKSQCSFAKVLAADGGNLDRFAPKV